MCRNKKETRSYVEILKTVGIDRPADMLFVTDDFREAVAAAAAGNELLVASKFTFILVLCVANCTYLYWVCPSYFISMRLESCRSRLQIHLVLSFNGLGFGTVWVIIFFFFNCSPFGSTLYIIFFYILLLNINLKYVENS